MQKLVFPIATNWARTNAIPDPYLHIIDFGFHDFHTLKASKKMFPVTNATFHIVVSGKGRMEMAGNCFSLQAGDTFFIPGNTDKLYCPDEQDPWQYLFFTLEGSFVETLFQSIGYTLHQPVYSCGDAAQTILDIMAELIETMHERVVGCNYFALSALYRIAGHIAAERQIVASVRENAEKHFSDRIKSCIANNYHDPNFKVSTICSMLFYSHTYLSRLFIKENGCTIQEYLIAYRMERAKELLQDMRLTVKTVANAVGYLDSIQFSKMFQHTFGITPSEYRNAFKREE